MVFSSNNQVRIIHLNLSEFQLVSTNYFSVLIIIFLNCLFFISNEQIPEEETNGEPEKKINKFGIGIEGGFSADKSNYTIEHEYYLYVYPDDREVRINEETLANEALNERVIKSLASVIKAESNLMKEELAAISTAWEGEKRFVSKHSVNLL